MAENHMADVRKILGMYPGETFRIEGMGDKLYNISGGGVVEVGADSERRRPQLLEDILNGSRSIIRTPLWAPKCGEVYWTVTTNPYDGWNVCEHEYCSTNADINNIITGNCFPTKEMAEAAAPRIVKFYEDVRGMVEE